MLRGKSISPGGLLDFLAEEGNFAPSEPLDIALFNPESKNREVDPQKNLEFCEKKFFDREDKRTNKAKEHMAIIDGDTGYVVDVAMGDETSVGITTRALRHIKNSIVTHSHPSTLKYPDVGGTFSLADVRSLSLGMKELRAVGVEGTYSLKTDSTSDVKGFIERVEKDKYKIQAKLEKVHNRCVDKVEKGEYKSKKAFWTDNSMKQHEVLHRYYQKVAKEYGIEYKLHENVEVVRKMKAGVNRTNRTDYKGEVQRKGAGSRTKVLGVYRDDKNKQLVHYRTNGQTYVTDGHNKWSGSEVQDKLNSSRRTGIMSSDSFVSWRNKRGRRK